MPQGFSKPTETTDTDTLYRFIKDKYVKRLYAPKNALDPVTEFFQGESDEIEQGEAEVKPTASMKMPTGLLDIDLIGSNDEHVEEIILKPAPTSSHVTVSTRNEAEKKPNEDLLAMLEEDTKNTTTTITTKKPVTNYVAPNKYAALDFVQGPVIGSNVYNIYNTYNMNISTGPSINYRYPANINNKPKKEVTYQ